jgi:hypothetical protein
MICRGKNVAALLSLTLACTAPALAQAPRERAPSGWRPLFDGKSLDGWERVGPGRSVVENGQLRTEGGMGLLWYAREKLGNCALRVVYRTGSERANSGVYVRIAGKPADPWYAVHHGFEVQIADAGRADRRKRSYTDPRRPTAIAANARRPTALFERDSPDVAPVLGGHGAIPGSTARVRNRDTAFCELRVSVDHTRKRRGTNAIKTR